MISTRWNRVLLIIASISIFAYVLFELIGFMWISDIMQVVFIAFYILMSIIWMRLLAAHTLLRLPQWAFLIVFPILLIIFWYETILALPWLLFLYPLFYSKKSRRIEQTAARLMYGIAVLAVLIVLLLRLLVSLVSEEKITELPSPFNNTKVTIIVHNYGARGGSTVGVLETHYFQLFKTKRIVFYGGYRDTCELEWRDKDTIQIDGNMIDLRKNEPAQERRHSW